MFKLRALSSTPEIIPIAGIHGLLTKPPSVLVAASGPASACKPKKMQQRRWRAGEGEGHRQRQWSLVHAEGRRKAGRKRRKIAKKEEENRAWRRRKQAPGEEGRRVTCPSRGQLLVGKISVLIPEVFHDFKIFFFFLYKNFQSQNNLHTFN